MSQFQKEIVQAVLIADNNVWNFKPLSDEGSTVGIQLLDIAATHVALFN